MYRRMRNYSTQQSCAINYECLSVSCQVMYNVRPMVIALPCNRDANATAARLRIVRSKVSVMYDLSRYYVRGRRKEDQARSERGEMATRYRNVLVVVFSLQFDLVSRWVSNELVGIWIWVKCN